MGEITLSLESPKMLHLRDIGEVGSKVETNIILLTKGFGSQRKIWFISLTIRIGLRVFSKATALHT
jgi:hypothetical protein